MVVNNTETLKRIIDMIEYYVDCGDFCPWGRRQYNYAFAYYNGRKRGTKSILDAPPHCISCWTVMGVPFSTETYDYLLQKCPCEYYDDDWDQILLQIVKARKHYGV